MTSYILMGGYQAKADKVKLSQALFEGVPKKIKFLICLFARNQANSDWAELFEENKRFFSELNQEINIEFILASEADFLNQWNQSDVIYFAGGDSIPLYSTLARIGNGWTKKLANKTIIGISASTDMLTTYCFDVQQGQIDKGLGLVPVKTIVHFQATGYEPRIGWKKAKQLLDEYGEKLPIYALREGEFVKILV